MTLPGMVAYGRAAVEVGQAGPRVLAGTGGGAIVASVHEDVYRLPVGVVLFALRHHHPPGADCAQCHLHQGCHHTSIGWRCGQLLSAFGMR